MPREGKRSLCCGTKAASSSSSSDFSFSISPSLSSLSQSITDRNLDMADSIVTRWNPEAMTFARLTSIFHQNRREARDFIETVNNLQKVMQFLLAQDFSSDKLARAHNLMEIAMKRLQKEFYQILSMNRAHLDPESVSTRSSRTSTGSSTVEYDDGVRAEVSEVEDASTLAMEDLRLIAECMISSGYAKECLEIYKTIRKSVVNEGIYRLGMEKLTSSQIHKMDWQVLQSRIHKWITAVRTAVKTLFHAERVLCDHVFASSDSIRESCFTEITKEGALILFRFPESVAKNSKKSPDKVFRILDMYTGISDHTPEIESIFSFHSTIIITSQVMASLAKLREFVRSALNDFESAVQKESSKSPVPDGGIHPLTIDVMNNLSVVAEYGNILSEILADTTPPPAQHSLPESYLGFSDFDEPPAPAVSLKMAWLILVLLCKLDAKAEYYKDASLGYLFLANNLQYVVVNVRTSNLKCLLGEQWLTKHESRVKHFASNYERLGWCDTINCIPSDPTAVGSPEKVKEMLTKFNASFRQAYKKQSVWVVPDRKLRDDIKLSIASKIAPLYREFLNAHRLLTESPGNSGCVVKYTPEDVGRKLSKLFYKSGGSPPFHSSV